jgi:hypothetical protein
LNATFALLTLAVLSLWLGGDHSTPLRRFFWAVPFAGAVVTGVAAGIVQPLALVWIAAFALATYSLCRGNVAGWRRGLAAGVVLALAGGLMAHQLPGFHNPLIISRITFSHDALPYRLHLNFDKTMVGLFLLGFCHPRIVRATEWRAMAMRAWPITVGMITLLLILALTSGYVRFDPKFPREAWLWMAVNLGFTCVAEEALFRGFIQAQLKRLGRNVPRGEWLALAVASVLFGLAHFAGGPAYVVLATIAGAGYGWVYQRTGRIEASILTHFALNATHFFGFTYPVVQTST